VRQDSGARTVAAEPRALRRAVADDDAAGSIDGTDPPRASNVVVRRDADARATEDDGDDRAPARREDGVPAEPRDGVPTMVRPEMPRLSSSVSSTRRPRKRSAAEIRRGDAMEYLRGTLPTMPSPRRKNKYQGEPR
jgi:hypothetical protein